MNYRLLTLLLIVNLLACPVRCFSCEANLVTGEEGASVSCFCCSDGDAPASSESPGPGNDDCNCQNCICEGAVVKADVELPDSVCAFVGLVLSGSHPATLRIDASSQRSLAPVGQFLCGRDVRVAHQSWLI